MKVITKQIKNEKKKKTTPKQNKTFLSLVAASAFQPFYNFLSMTKNMELEMFMSWLGNF